jgi:DNA-binding LytR/AlgR family response regulator
MNIAIIEDEPLARQELKRRLTRCDKNVDILAFLESVGKSVGWFKEKKPVDLIFMDIQLSDGLSFEIFERVRVPAPVIFTTAYDEYAIQAFKVNSIDYLLKPINDKDLKSALQKYAVLKEQFNEKAIAFKEHQIAHLYDPYRTGYKKRFISKVGDDFKYINVEAIAYFYAEHKVVTLVSNDKKEFVIDYTLENLEKLLDPTIFFRLNRKYLVKIDAIKKVSKYFRGRLKVTVRQAEEDEILVSRDKKEDFKSWLDS